jgi:hypothetical protein
MSLVLEWTVEYYGFELEHEVEVLPAWGPELADRARRALAVALARGEAQHPAVRRNQPAIDEVRELWRRSGGRTAKLGEPELTALYEAQLGGVTTMQELHERSLELGLEALVPPEVRERLLSLPDVVSIRDTEVSLGYEVEQEETGQPVAVVRLDLPEKLARTLVEEELPPLDRPMRFTVGRGRRGALRADTLLELQELLDQPWTPDEIEAARDDRSRSVSGRPAMGHGRPPRKTGTAPRRPGRQGTGPSRGTGGRRGGGGGRTRRPKR